MTSYRQNPEGEQNQQATRQAAREMFALQMQAATLRKSRRVPTIQKNRTVEHCEHCGMLSSQCDCWDTVNGGD